MVPLYTRAYRDCGVGRERECGCWIVNVEKCSALGVERIEITEKISVQSYIKPDSNSCAYRIRKLLTRDPSTPVMKDGPISHGNVEAGGRLTAGVVVDACGVSNEIVAMAS